MSCNEQLPHKFRGFSIPTCPICPVCPPVLINPSPYPKPMPIFDLNKFLGLPLPKPSPPNDFDIGQNIGVSEYIPTEAVIVLDSLAKDDAYEADIDEALSGGPAPIVAPVVPPSCTYAWVQVAVEGQSVNFTETVDVAFGTSLEGFANFQYKVDGLVPFTTERFGDPHVGVTKLGWFRCPPPPVGPTCTDDFFWSSPPIVNGNTATGVINDINYTYTSSHPVQTLNWIWGYENFPAIYEVPYILNIRNVEATTNTLTFSSPILNPVLLFASIGSDDPVVGITVPITFSNPITVKFSQGVTVDSPTRITGREGYAIIQYDGYFSSVSFQYSVAEDWCNFMFGANFCIPDISPPPAPIPGPAPALTPALTRFVPDVDNRPSLGRDCIEHMSTMSLPWHTSGPRHDPDGISWIPTTAWSSSTWDGVTTLNPCGKTKNQIVSWVWPNSMWVMRGLREFFYSVNPFADNSHPTVAEVENWNVEVVRHFRRLLGISHPISATRALHLQAHWSDERKFSTYWDAAYPGTLGSASGPCVGMVEGVNFNAHCGSTFVPSCQDQAPYLEPGEACQTLVTGAEGVFLAEQDWPWAVKLSRVMYGIVLGEGMTGHAGPFYGRSYMGLSWYCRGDTNVVLRATWSGPVYNPCP